MSQHLLNLGPLPALRPPRPGAPIVADRPGLGRCVLKIRRVHATAVTADRIEVILAAHARGEAVPRTKPHTLLYGTFHPAPGATP